MSSWWSVAFLAHLPPVDLGGFFFSLSLLSLFSAFFFFWVICGASQGPFLSARDKVGWDTHSLPYSLTINKTVAANSLQVHASPTLSSFFWGRWCLPSQLRTMRQCPELHNQLILQTQTSFVWENGRACSSMKPVFHTAVYICAFKTLTYHGSTVESV